MHRLDKRVEALQKSMQGKMITLHLPEGEYKCNFDDLMELYSEILNAQRGKREPEHPLFEKVMQADPEQEKEGSIIGLMQMLHKSRENCK